MDFFALPKELVPREIEGVNKDDLEAPAAEGRTVVSFLIALVDAAIDCDCF